MPSAAEDAILANQAKILGELAKIWATIDTCKAVVIPRPQCARVDIKSAAQLSSPVHRSLKRVARDQRLLLGPGPFSKIPVQLRLKAQERIAKHIPSPKRGNAWMARDYLKQAVQDGRSAAGKANKDQQVSEGPYSGLRS